MTDLIDRVRAFETHVHPRRQALYGRLARDGQSPAALMIACADSRIVPEHVLQADPGDLFVCRNAGNIVPPAGDGGGGVEATIEYAVAVLGIREIIVCGHSDCGAMKGLAGPREALAALPSVADWIDHAAAAREAIDPMLGDEDRLRALTFENIVVQLAHLRAHPAVAALVARGEVTLHGWYVDIHAGRVLALDGETGRFAPVATHRPLPLALAPEAAFADAAE